MQLEYLNGIIDCKSVVVWGRNEKSLIKYKKDFSKSNFDITITKNINDIIERCQLIVTCTPSDTPIVTKVNPGTHITAMGSDTLTKQEIASSILFQADLVVADSRSQCEDRGEIHQAIKDGFSMKDVVEIGDIIQGKAKQRENDKQITVADHTGVAVQDIQISKAVLKYLN
jgi:ornithine cyclodeaminase